MTAARTIMFEGVSPIEVLELPATAFSAAFLTVEVELPDSGRRIKIEASGPRVAYGGSVEVGPEVSWPSIGSVGFADAAVFATLVRCASELAAGLAGATG